eukprot:TRINITY_DN6904_c0_g1_i1.p1 TRINITY_DN6904_c0_g1~~TRINITY_DN6904_c0_g1_i1.p1  ORF type:complete len:413 (-),score=72.71 TRINITY_DN6904_c0_g1_i1:92-1330(-)
MIYKVRHLRNVSDFLSYKKSVPRKENSAAQANRLGGQNSQNAGDNSLSRNNSTKDARKSLEIEVVYQSSKETKQSLSILSPYNREVKKPPSTSTGGKGPHLTKNKKSLALSGKDRLTLSGRKPILNLEPPISEVRHTAERSKGECAQGTFRASDLTNEMMKNEEKLRKDLNSVANKLNNLVINYNNNITENHDYSDILEVITSHLRLLDEYLSSRPGKVDPVLNVIRNNEGRLHNLIKAVVKQASRMQSDFEAVAEELKCKSLENQNLYSRLTELQPGSMERIPSPVASNERRKMTENVEQLQELVRQQECLLSEARQKEANLLKLLHFIHDSGIDVDKIYMENFADINQKETLEEDDLMEGTSRKGDLNTIHQTKSNWAGESRNTFYPQGSHSLGGSDRILSHHTGKISFS